MDCPGCGREGLDNLLTAYYYCATARCEVYKFDGSGRVVEWDRELVEAA